MKFLIHGNSPTAKTGYGVQIGHLVNSLAADGHEPAVSATYGIQGGVENWNGIRIYGCGYDTNSNDRIHMHAHHWFKGDPGWIVTVIDVWAMKNPLLAQFNTAAWVPIDHFTSVGPQPNVLEFFERTGAVPIAMSRFGEMLLTRAGLDPVYIPLSVNTDECKPTEVLSNGMSPRELLEIPEDAFLVGMVAMNKGWARDRKGFNEAFWAFGMFERDHPDAYLYVHADAAGGAEGIDLHALAIHSGIPPHKIVFGGGPNQYGYYIGYTAEMMAAMYTSFDVLLAPSHGEGFCVPIIEAHACGTPVIATNFSAQTELVPEGTGWLVEGQPEWDPAHQALYKVPLIGDVLGALTDAYEADRAGMVASCVDHALEYDTKHVYETYWKPFIAELEATPAVLPLEREPMPAEAAVAVICPIYKRLSNVTELAESFLATTEPGEAKLYFVTDELDRSAVAQRIASLNVRKRIEGLRASGDSCGHKWNDGYKQTHEPWVLCIGDDVRFKPGWLDAARKLSGEFDVIGTNDTSGDPKNPKVANGAHADHFFIRRAYIDEYGASLDGPGVLASDAYHHWWTDEEIIRLARVRGVFTPCLDSVVEHLHPGYDGREDLRAADETYMAAVEHRDADAAAFRERVPLIEMQRTTRSRV